MKKNYLRVLSLGLALCATQVNAQTPDQIAQIKKENNQERLAQLEQQFLQINSQQRQLAKQQATQKGLETLLTLEDGGLAELQRILPDGTPVYYRTFNANTAVSTRTTHINAGGSLGLNLMGQNMTAYVWDGGHARASHQEYDGTGGTNRYTVQDEASEGIQLNYHAAHVTGTIMASGVQAEAQGMAPHVTTNGYRWNDDVAEATAAAANGMLISNHSYGLLGTTIPDQWFGSYSSESQSWDEIMYNAPFYLMVAAAGNEGNIDSFNGAPLGGNPTYDKLTGKAITKNNLVVANAQDASVGVDGSLYSVTINGGSSEGPTDDFRIKPDIAGNGTEVYSTFQNSDTAYNSLSGTSMASPNVMGSLLLLQQHYNDVNGAFAKAATLKGLALHTADDAGSNGPDAIFGWGLLNAKRMAETVTANGTTATIDERTLTDGDSYQTQITVPAGKILQASISWTDAPGTPVTGTNDPTPVLINDLDIRITKDADTFMPWRLTGVDSNAKEDNVVDPYERVDVEGADGTYTITVTHKGSLFSGSQNYTLIITTIDTPVEPVNECIVQVNTFPYTQGFNNTLGQWTQDSNDDFDWAINSGITQSNGTGPSDAIEGSHYIYMETSSPNNPGKTAILNSPCFDFTGMTEAQATFQYHMTGDAVGSIRLEASTNSGISWTEVWHKSGNQGSNWQKATVDLNAYVGGTVSLRLQGGSGNGWQGDIAIDDLMISEGAFVDIIAPSTPINLSTSDITETTLNLTWDASTDNVAVTGYDVYVDNVLFNTTATNSINISGLVAETTYALSVSAKDEAGNVSATSASINATTLAAESNQIPPTGYCSSNGNIISDEYIQRVQIGTIDNTTGASAGGYGDFTNLSTELGTNNTITITPQWTGRVYSEAYAVFVDWNRDGDFGDAGETVYTRAATTATPITGTFSVPAGAAIGATRMRVSMKYNGLPTACESFQYGEVEDYIVTVGASSGTFSDGDTTTSAFETNSNTSFEFSVFPNPVTRGQLSIHVTGTDVERYTIYNMLGQVVSSDTFSNTLDVSRLKAGMYIIEIAIGDQTQAKRFIKK
ncbi:S8 family serine peptidase [Dokdonia sp.]|uniref:S8 family serine peptidase n=1 Tax=Dokdonia sp. TaxID=2024995 RepID=UPI003264950A